MITTDKHKVLIVEDEKNIREGLHELLTISNFDVTAAADCSEAKEHLEYFKPDIILCDIMMPSCSGYELLEHIQQIDTLKKVPFIFVSARAELDQIRQGMNLGADDYITKPFDYDQLLKAINVRLQKTAQFATTASVNPLNEERKQQLEEKLEMISKSEWRVMELLANNLSSDEISQQLYLSIKTVQNHKANVVKKLGMEGQNTLLSFAVECRVLGLI
jgi:two-component system, OmpR family, response regulator